MPCKKEFEAYIEKAICTRAACETVSLNMKTNLENSRQTLANQLFASVFGSGFAATSKPQFFAQPRPLIVKYDSAWPEKQYS